MMRGGPRPGSGRPPKPALTQLEFEAIKELRGRGKGKHGTSWVAAAHLISKLRGAHDAIDPRTIANRKVSSAWASRAFNAMETKMQNQSKPQTNATIPEQIQSVAAYTGPRIDRPTLEENADHFLQPQKAKDEQAQANVEVASGGEKA